MPEFGFDLDRLLADALIVLLAFALALPIGWERGRGAHSVGFRTLPVVAMAACGFARIVEIDSPESVEAQARVLQGVISGVGFIGGGAIVKHGADVRGLVTAASVWNAGAIGVAVGIERANIAVVLSVANVVSLWALSLIRGEVGRDGEDGDRGDG